MGFVVPNSGESSYPVQSEPDRGDFTALTAAARGTGVVSGCAVTATGTPDLTTHIASGVVSVGGVEATPAADSLTHRAADGSYDRIDLVVYVDAATPGYSILEGTPAVTPLFSSAYDPSIHVFLAAVLVEASSTAITPGHIVDKRVMYLSGSGSMSAADILAALLTVDGPGSGLDADTLDGISSTGFESAGAVSTHDAATDPHGDRAYADGLFASNDAMLFKGVIDCSTNPNYPAADAGHVYKVSVAGKIGGASGVNVEVGDTAICAVDSTLSGSQSLVGSNWFVIQANIDGAVTGPASSTIGNVPTFNGSGGKVLQDSGTALSSLLTSSVAASTYQPIDSDLTAIAALSTTTYGRSLLEAANAAAARSTLSLGSAATSATTDFDASGAAAAAQAASQPLDSDLTAIAALSTTNFGRSLLALADAAALRTAAGTVIGTDVQAYDAELAAIAGLTSASDKVPYFTGSGAAALLTRDTDGTLAGNSDTNLATQKATKTYADTKVAQSLLTTKGDMPVATASSTWARKAAPANGKIRAADSAQSDGWKDIDLPWCIPVDPVKVAPYSATGFASQLGLAGNYAQMTALNDEAVFKLLFGPGTWTFNLWRTTFSSYGILTVSIDGTTVATLDNYSGASINPGFVATTGITISAPGVYDVKLKTTGKNASSSNYNQRIWGFDFTRTA